MFRSLTWFSAAGATWASQRLLGSPQRSTSATEISRPAVDPTDYRMVAAGAMLPNVVDRLVTATAMATRSCSALALSWAVVGYKALAPSPSQPWGECRHPHT